MTTEPSITKGLVYRVSQLFAVLLLAPAAANAASLSVFDDAVTPLWQLSAWTGTATIQSQFAKSGSAVRVDAGTWGGMTMDSRTANWVWTDQPATLYTVLSFDVSAGPLVGTTMGSLQASLALGFGTAANLSAYVPATGFAANVWYHVDIPLSSINPLGVPFQKIMFQNNSTANLTFYIDNVVLRGVDTVAPSTPTGLTASAVSPSQINLSWTASTDNVGVTAYNVFRGGAQIATTTATSYSDTGRAASTAYSYVVSARDAAGNVSAQSSAAGATTQPPPPVTGTPIFADAVNPLWQLSAWTATATVQSQFAQSGSAIRVDAATWGGMDLDSRDVNWVWTDQPGGLYTRLSFDVSAGQTVGATMSSLRVGLDDSFTLSALLSTYVPSFAAGVWYHVDIPLSAMNPQGIPFRKIAFQNNNTPSLTFYVDNVVLLGAGIVDHAAPSTPTGLTASAGLPGQINLSWTASTDNFGVTGYTVFNGGVQIATTKATSFSVTGLLALTTYTFTVAAFDAAGNTSAQSASASATTTQPGGTGAPLQSCARIMPLGDSITAGTNGNYRNDLYTGLLQNNCGVSFVGTLTDPNTLVPDKQHEGHAGFYIGNIADNIDAWMTATLPNIVLLMIGTNDTAWWTNDVAVTHAAHHDALIAQIQADFVRLGRPNPWIFVASIPPQRSMTIHLLPTGTETCEGLPCTTGDRVALVQQFNVEMKKNVDARVAKGESVRFVDVNSALKVEDLDSEPGNGVHPNSPAAYSKIAAKFLEAIRAALDPGTSPGGLVLDINTSVSRTPISPYVYGVNQLSPTAKNIGAARYGGNRFTVYNWENNYSSGGSDFINSNDTFLIDNFGVNGALAGEVVRVGVQHAFDAGAAAMVTLPMAGWVAADKLGTVCSPASSTNPRFLPSLARKPTARTYPPNLNDGAVYQDEFVAYIESQFARVPGQVKQVFYSFDNEPDLWASTHPLLRKGCFPDQELAFGCGAPTCAAPVPLSYAEAVSLATNYGQMVKDIASTALTFGPASYGFNGFQTFQGGARDPSYILPVGTDPEERKLDFLAYYLSRMKSAQATDGRRLLDALDVHWYSEAKPVSGGVRVWSDASTTPAPDMVAARVQAPRSLWDATYTESSWITQFATNGPIRLIPRLKKIIADNYPDTKIAFTEYSHGGGVHISDAVAEADTLGIFGREGIYAAMFFALPSDAYPNAAIRMFRDYDGLGAMVGDVSVFATTTDIAKIAVYSMAHAGNDNLVDAVVINRQTTAQPVTVRLTHPVAMSRVKIYQLDGTNPAPYAPRATGPFTVSGNQYLYTAPPLSVTTLVFGL